LLNRYLFTTAATLIAPYRYRQVAAGGTNDFGVELDSHDDVHRLTFFDGLVVIFRVFQN
jgi:hypothetical protein